MVNDNNVTLAFGLLWKLFIATILLMLIQTVDTKADTTTNEPTPAVENWVLDNCFDRDGIYEGYNNPTCEKYIDPSIYE